MYRIIVIHIYIYNRITIIRYIPHYITYVYIYGNIIPISMLPIIGKLFENQYLSNSLIILNLVDVYQSAYMKGHNTETALLATMNGIYISLNKHSRIKLLQLDLSYAFDSISHDILINRLSQIGITGDGLKMFILLIKE